MAVEVRVCVYLNAVLVQENEIFALLLSKRAEDLTVRPVAQDAGRVGVTCLRFLDLVNMLVTLAIKCLSLDKHLGLCVNCRLGNWW